MSEIPPELVDKMMVKCARRCCICRRFRPTRLQVHHIRERGQGGGNEDDNLIVVCLSCHSDVHTKVPFARRFSQEELRGHRDALVRMVEKGKLPVDDADDASEAVVALLREMQASSKDQPVFSPEAVEILLRAASTTGAEQGSVLVSLHFGGLTVKMGATPLTIGHDDRRTQAKYKQAIEQLVGAGLLAHRSKNLLDVTEAGYVAADEIMVSRVQAPTNA
jgi:hypothetical protein